MTATQKFRSLLAAAEVPVGAGGGSDNRGGGQERVDGVVELDGLSFGGKVARLGRKVA